MRRWLKIFGYSILGFNLLLAGLVLFTQTPIFKNWLKNKIVAVANKNLNATLSIGKIQGNLLSHFQVLDIVLMNGRTDSIRRPTDRIGRALLTTNADTILTLPELAINLSPAKIIKKQIIIELLALDSLHFRFRQLPDSTWNVEHLMTSEPGTVPKNATETAGTSSPIKWRIALKDMKIKNSRIDIIPLKESSFIPQRIENINTRASLIFDRNGLKADLKELRLLAQHPNFVLKKLSLDLSLVKNNLKIRQLVLQTSNSRVQGEGNLILSDAPRFRVSLSASPFDFSEVSNFMPDFPMRIQAKMNLVARLEPDSLKFDLGLEHQNQSFKLNGDINNLTDNPNFRLAAMLTRVNLEDWLTIPDLTGLINGQLNLRGNGNSQENAHFYLTGNFHDGIIYQRSFNQIQIKADYLQGDMTSDIQAIGNFGRFQLKGKVADILNDQKFKLDGKFNHIDLRHLALDDSLQSDITVTLQAGGTSFLPGKMQSKFIMEAAPSVFMGFKIDTLFSMINFQNNNFTIDTLDAASPMAQLHLSGNLDLNAESRVRFNGEIRDLEQIRSTLLADSLSARGTIAGDLHGTFDSLFCDAKFSLQNILYNMITSDSASGDVNLSFISDSLKLQSTSQVKRLVISNFPFDSVQIRMDLVNNFMRFSADVFHSDSINGEVEATLLADSLTQLTIPRIVLNLRNQTWTGGNDSMQLLIGQDDFEFHNIELTSGEQFMRFGGRLNLVGDQNLFVQISNIDIAPFLKLADIPLDVAGKINLFIEMRGTAESPFIEGVVSISDGRVNEYNFQGVDLNVSYENQVFMFIVNLNYDKTNSLVSIGSIPMNLSLINNKNILNDDEPIVVNLKADGLDLSVLQALTEDIRNVKGKILIDLELENTLKDPTPSGFLRLVDGRLRIPKFGLNYKDIQLYCVVDSSSFAIENFQTRSDKGILTATGKIDFTRTGFGGVIKTTDVNLTAENFLAVNNKNYEIIVGGDVKLTGDPISPQFGGSIRVHRSRFYIPALVQSSPGTVEDIKPILVDALKDSSHIQVELAEKTGEAIKILENLTGSIKVEIPRNTWLRSSEMNVEIAGDLDIVKQSENFELFGTIRVLRGVYDLYGKRFRIQKGSFSFEGGAEYNPEIELVAEYVFRTFNREKRTLTLEVTGKAMTPKLQFSLDDVQISEGDAVSYLLLGRSLEELTHGQRNELSQQAGFDPGSKAGSIMVGLVAGQLSKTLGKTLNLDVIEVRGEENWQQATFVVGKYLTNDLFLRYQKEFGFRQTNELQPDEITLEYEINRRIFLQLTKGSEKTTGFDVILKFEK